MLKRIAFLLLIFTISITTSSCTPSSYGVWKDMCDTYPDQKGKVKVVSDDDQGNYHIEYEDCRYNFDELHLFEVRKNVHEIHENDILIGWDSLPFGVWYFDKYYSNTADNPIFIYMSRLPDVYLRSDYDYKEDTFILKGTNHQFVFSDMFTLSNAFSYNFMNLYADEMDITLYSDMYPRLQISLRLFCINNIWFVGGNSNNSLFEVSNEFLGLLNIDTYVKSE